MHVSSSRAQSLVFSISRSELQEIIHGVRFQFQLLSSPRFKKYHLSRERVVDNKNKRV